MAETYKYAPPVAVPMDAFGGPVDPMEMDRLRREREAKMAAETAARNANQRQGLSPADVQTRVDAANAAAPQDAGAMVSPAAPVAPSFTPGRMEKTGSSTTTSRTIIDPTARKAFEERSALVGTEAELAQKVAEEKKRVAEIEAQGAKDRLAASAAREAELAKAQQVAETEKAAAAAKHAAAIEDFKKAEPRDFWADKTEYQKSMAGVAMALGAFGSSLTGGPNQAAQIINGAIDRDFEKQKLILDKKEKLIGVARDGMNDARQNAADRMTNLELRKIAAKERYADDLESKLKARGGNIAEMEGAQAVVQLRKQAALEKQKFFEQQNKQVQSTVTHQLATGGTVTGGGGASEVTGKPASDKEREIDSYADRMLNAYKTLRNAGGISEEGAKLIASHGRWGNDFGDSIFGTLEERLNPKDLVAYQAAQEFARAKLRKESGAAISHDEMAQEMAAATRRPGENEESLRNKFRTMETSLLGLGRGSYRPSYYEQALRPPAPQAADPIQQADQARQWLAANPKADPNLRRQVMARIGLVSRGGQ